MAPGVIVREENGMIIEDLDGDGIEETGWDIMYMHIGDNDHVALGTRVNTNDKIGPSLFVMVVKPRVLTHTWHASSTVNGCWQVALCLLP